MVPDHDILGQLKSAESQYLERKTQCPKDAELRATLCAFANSTPEGQYSVLFLGVEDNGDVCGLDPATLDGTQKKILRIAHEDCYPPINAFTQVVVADGRSVIAVVVEHSKETPHFVGHAYTRQGPTNRKASDALFESLILKRTDKVARLLRMKEKMLVVRVQWTLPPVAGRQAMVANMVGYRVEACDSFVLVLSNTATHASTAVPIGRVTISYSTDHHSDLLIIDQRYSPT